MMGLKNGYPKLYTILRVRLVCLVLVAFVFIFSACGETTEEADNRLEVIEEEETITEEVITKENTEIIKEDAEIIKEDAEITICMVGDVLLHTPIEDYSKNEENEYDYSPIFANVKKEIESVDLAIVNQEVIIGGRELGVSGYPAFNAPTEIGDELVKTGFDVVCHATNHALDKGKKGLINCCSFWNEEHPEIAMLGIHESSEDAENIYIYEKNGLKIAILNYTYGTNGISLPEGMPYCVELLNEDKVKSDIARAEAEADFTIVVPHWGTEYLLTPDSMQKKWTKIFMENGVDLVIGAHPHVIEPVEMMEDGETGRKMLVYYSLGNFVNWTSGTGEGVANRMVGGMAKVTISSEDFENTGELSIKEYGVEGLVSHVTSQTGGITVYPISEYNSQLAGENEIVNQDSNFSYEYCVELCDRVWGDLYH